MRAGSAADGSAIEDLPMGKSAGVSLVARRGQFVQVRGGTVLAPGNEVLVLVDPPEAEAVERLFTLPAPVG